MFQIWFERPLPPAYAGLIDGIATASWPDGLATQAVAATLGGVHGIVASARIQYDAALMEQAPELRVISRTGIGVDNISLADATARGICVCNAPDAPSTSTAEHAFLLILALLKQLPAWHNVLRQPERMDFFSAYDGIEAEGLRLGVVGLGRIGSRVARMGGAVGMRVAGFDPYCPAERPTELGIEAAATLEDLLAASDVVTLHLPVTPATHQMMNAKRFAVMRPGSFLVNTARGGLVDENALLHALESGHLRGAGLDVFGTEPPPPDHPLVLRPDVIATPHIGGATTAAKDRLWRTAIMQVLQVLRGERPTNLVNPEVWQMAEKP